MADEIFRKNVARLEEQKRGKDDKTAKAREREEKKALRKQMKEEESEVMKEARLQLKAAQAHMRQVQKEELARRKAGTPAQAGGEEMLKDAPPPKKRGRPSNAELEERESKGKGKAKEEVQEVYDEPMMPDQPFPYATEPEEDELIMEDWPVNRPKAPPRAPRQLKPTKAPSNKPAVPKGTRSTAPPKVKSPAKPSTPLPSPAVKGIPRPAAPQLVKQPVSVKQLVNAVASGFKAPSDSPVAPSKRASLPDAPPSPVPEPAKPVRVRRAGLPGVYIPPTPKKGTSRASSEAATVGPSPTEPAVETQLASAVTTLPKSTPIALPSAAAPEATSSSSTSLPADVPEVRTTMPAPDPADPTTSPAPTPSTLDPPPTTDKQILSLHETVLSDSPFQETPPSEKDAPPAESIVVSPPSKVVAPAPATPTSPSNEPEAAEPMKIDSPAKSPSALPSTDQSLDVPAPLKAAPKAVSSPLPVERPASPPSSSEPTLLPASNEGASASEARPIVDDEDLIEDVVLGGADSVIESDLFSEGEEEQDVVAIPMEVDGLPEASKASPPVETGDEVVEDESPVVQPESEEDPVEEEDLFLEAEEVAVAPPLRTKPSSSSSTKAAPAAQKAAQPSSSTSTLHPSRPSSGKPLPDARIRHVAASSPPSSSVASPGPIMCKGLPLQPPPSTRTTQQKSTAQDPTTAKSVSKEKANKPSISASGSLQSSQVPSPEPSSRSSTPDARPVRSIVVEDDDEVLVVEDMEDAAAYQASGSSRTSLVQKPNSDTPVVPNSAAQSTRRTPPPQPPRLETSARLSLPSKSKSLSVNRQSPAVLNKSSTRPSPTPSGLQSKNDEQGADPVSSAASLASLEAEGGHVLTKAQRIMHSVDHSLPVTVPELDDDEAVDSGDELLMEAQVDSTDELPPSKSGTPARKRINLTLNAATNGALSNGKKRETSNLGSVNLDTYVSLLHHLSLSRTPLRQPLLRRKPFSRWSRPTRPRRKSLGKSGKASLF